MAEKLSAKLIDDTKILVKDADGTETEYDVAFSCEEEGSGKTFVAYTEYKVDKAGKPLINAFYYTDDKNKLQPVESKEDKEAVNEFWEEIWEEIQSEIDEQGLKKFLEDYDEGELSDLQDEMNKVLEKMDAESWIALMSANIDKVKEEEVLLLADVAEDIVNKCFEEKYLQHKDGLIALLRKIDSRLDGHSSMGKLGEKSYENKDYAIAEMAFKEAQNWNNLAYMIRRNEVTDPGKYSNKYVADLLKEGVHKKDTFSMINMALLWALNIKGEEAWQLADDIMSMLSSQKIPNAALWWETAAKKGDIEGYLVHYWLLKYKRIQRSPLGNMHDLRQKIQTQIDGFPADMI